MHVLQLGPYPPPEGGINRNMLAIRDELLKNGHRCSIIATSRSTAITNELDVHHPRLPFAVAKLLFTIPYDLLHLHVGGDISPRVLALIFVCGFFGRGKNILSFHSGGYPETQKGKSAKKASFRGFIFRRFAKVIAVNQLIAEVFERYGLASDKIHVIYPYVHRLPDKSIEVPTQLREFAARSKPFLLTVGLLEDEYDLFMQIDAMEKVLQGFPEAGLMIVGSGSLEVELQAAIAAKPYADRIFLADDVPHKITLHLINDCDILLRTTRFDGDAISVREALFLDTPVIATDNGMRPLGVYLVPVHDIDALVCKINDLVAQEKSVKIGNTDDNSNITSILRLYDSVLNGS